MDDLHPYDGKERRFRHTDEDPVARDRGRTLVGRLLQLPEPPTTPQLRYDLSYLSGGMGVFDRLFVELPADADRVAAIAGTMELLTPQQAADDPEWGEAFIWLVSGDDEPVPSLDAAVREFIDEERSDRLPTLSASGRAWFQRCSDVNSWLVLYEYDRGVCAMAYDQG